MSGGSNSSTLAPDGERAADASLHRDHVALADRGDRSSLFTDPDGHRHNSDDLDRYERRAAFRIDPGFFHRHYQRHATALGVFTPL